MMKLGIVGSGGRLGQAILVAAAEHGAPVVLTGGCGGTHRHGTPSVLVCAATRDGVEQAASLAATHRLPLVVASSGLLDRDRARLAGLAQQVPVLVAGNLSRGHQVQRMLVEAVSRALGPGFTGTVAVIDRHAPTKRDRPSATALALAGAWQGAAGAEVGISSIRAGGPVADHTVLVTLPDDETLIVEHRVPSLRPAAAGALRAAGWLVDQPAGWYDAVPADVPDPRPAPRRADLVPVPAAASAAAAPVAPVGGHDVVACA